MKVSGQLHAAVALSPRKAPAVAIDQGASWTDALENRKISYFSRESNRSSSVVQPAAQPGIRFQQVIFMWRFVDVTLLTQESQIMFCVISILFSTLMSSLTKYFYSVQVNYFCYALLICLLSCTYQHVTKCTLVAYNKFCQI